MWLSLDHSLFGLVQVVKIVLNFPFEFIFIFEDVFKTVVFFNGVFLFDDMKQFMLFFDYFLNLLW